MSTSPLKQLNTTPQQHKPKSSALYDALFTTSNHPPGFWVELFILPVSRPHLAAALEAIPREQIIADPIVLRTLFSAAAANTMSGDWFIVQNSLEILGIVLEWLLRQHFSSHDTLEAISGLENANKFFDGVGQGLLRALDNRPEFALEFFLRILPHALGTSVASYFSSRNFFRPLVRLLDSDHAAEALVLVGVFCLLNKREDHADPYRVRIADFIDEEAIVRALNVVDSELKEVSPPPAQTWLSWFQKEQPRVIDTKPLAILHCVYEFVNHNELFSLQFARSTAYQSFFEVGSLLVQNQHKSSKYRDYSVLILFILRILVERASVHQELCEKAVILIVAQQREPKLSIDAQPRAALSGVLDIVQCCLRFNVRHNLDHLMYSEALTVLFQALNGLRTGTAAIEYDWPQLWRTIFSLINHLSGRDGSGDGAVAELLMLNLAALCLSPALYTDHYSVLLEKLFGSQELLKTVSLKYGLGKTAPVAALHAMTAHYELLSSQTPGLELTSEVTAKIVKQGNHAVGAAEGAHKLQGLPRFSESSCQRFFAHEARTVLRDAEWGAGVVSEASGAGGSSGGAGGSSGSSNGKASADSPSASS